MYKTTYIEVTKYATVCQAFNYIMCLIYKAIYIGVVSQQLSAKFLSILSHLQSCIQCFYLISLIYKSMNMEVASRRLSNKFLSHLSHLHNYEYRSGVSTTV